MQIWANFLSVTWIAYINIFMMLDAAGNVDDIF